MGAWWLWKAGLANELARSFRTILPLLALSKPCANLALPCSTILHLVGGPLLEESVKHAKGNQMSRWSFFAYFTFLESAHMCISTKKPQP